MKPISRAKEKSDNYIRRLPAGGGLWGPCKDEASDILFQASKKTGWDVAFLEMIHEGIVYNKHGGEYGDILAAAYLVRELAEEDEPLYMISSALEKSYGDIGLVMDIFVELIDDDNADLEEAAIELESICWKRWEASLA